MAQRVLFVTDSLMLGGVETQLVDLVTRLDRGAFDPIVLSLYGKRASDDHFAARLHAAGIPVVILDRRLNPTDKARMVYDIARAVRAYRPAIVQAENYHANLLTRAARPFMPKTKLIGTQRTFYTSKQLRYERLDQRFTDVLVASSPHLKQQLVDIARIPPDKVRVILNSIDTRRFAAPQDATVRARVAPRARRVLLSLGRISAMKRMHLIVEGMGRLKQRGQLPGDAQLLIVGPAQDPAMLRRIMDAVTTYDLADQITRLPGTDAPEDFYAAADVTMLYTVDEGLSCVMLESLAAGRPVLISEESNGAGVIMDGVTGWVAPTHDSDAFTATLQRVLTMPAADLHAMRAACVAQAARYSIDILAQHYMNLYAELTG
jgi:glycosyltransferase involved in cell wall biosynthesis